MTPEEYAEAYQEGRDSAFKEILHEHKKFIDGFGHPKDCEMCKQKV